MDKSVDQDVEAPASDGEENETEEDPVDDAGSEDIASELYSSTREVGMAAVAFGPVEGI